MLMLGMALSIGIPTPRCQQLPEMKRKFLGRRELPIGRFQPAVSKAGVRTPSESFGRVVK
jgi:hypothetical protein